MKKIVMAFVMGAGRLFAQDDCQESMSEVTTWKDSLMQYWDNLSHTHKMIAYGIAALVILMIVYRLIKCGIGGCGCECSGSCNCHK